MGVTIIGDLPEEITIWRYLSLDKLISLLDERKLYFPSLKTFARSDPFEGWPPSRVMEKVFEILTDCGPPEMKERECFKDFTSAIFKATVVNCWHANSDESEAMWKLYGENHKGVAIKSTVGRLSGSLKTDQAIRIGKVSYADYKDPSKEALQGCLVSGLGPLIKRNSYAHEREIRAFFLPKGSTVVNPTYASASVDVDLDLLVEEIVISPFAVEPYQSAVHAIARAYGLDRQVRASVLLQEADNVFDFMAADGFRYLT